MQPECTKDVVECFPELLLALISIAIPIKNIQSSASRDKDIIHKLNCVILGKLLDVNQDLLIYVLHYFDVNPAPFELFDDSLDTLIPVKRQNRRKFSRISEVSDHDIVIACHSILQSAVSHFKHKWNWSKFYKYLTNADDRVKWVALKCIAIVLNMSESTRLSWLKTLILNFGKFLIDYEDKSVDTSIICVSFESMEDTVKNISSIISVGGILLPTLGKTHSTYNLVPVSSMKKNLQSLAIAIGSRKCICLQGPVGCGKTALVEYLARVTGHDSSNFIKVQLGDQTDSKMLLGMYRCTDVPGEFVWQPGVLTQAVIAGKWLLLEDVDSAALDVASVLSNLMETGTLCVPGYRDTIYVNSGFQLFVTQRLMMSVTGIQKHVTGSSSLLQKHWLCLNMEPLSTDELVIVVQTLFPVLNSIATKIIDVFLLFSVGDYDSGSNACDATLSLKIGRQMSTRDLIKWCSRAIVDFVVSSPDSLLKIFQDALDVFCCSVSNQEQRLNLAKKITDKLGIIREKAEHFCNKHKPFIDLLPDLLVAGRAKLTRKKAEYARIDIEKINFSFTRPSACLLERIAICIKQKEPVLLVGETGTGKTSSIQYLARSTGHKLVVINMNQQSESADLLGGYKPVDLKFLISPIREEFEILFRSYFIIEPNKEFLKRIASCHKQQKKDILERFGQNKKAQKKSDQDDDLNMLKKWEKMLEKLDKLRAQVKSQYALAFSFIEGSLVRALRDGYWVLLDEINLANAETLECLSGLLEGSSESLSLLERGDGEPVKRHPDFTVFACMNPATDVGKRDLPVGLRNRFTEFYVDELTEQSDLELLVSSYLAELNLPEKHKAIVKFYLNVRKEAMSTLFDGTAHKPHYSLRTLCRALYISASNPCSNVLRSLYESFSLSFLTQLDYNSYPIVQKMIAKAILNNKNIKEILGIPIPKPKCSPGEDYIYIEGYWVLQGSLTPEIPTNYILTDSVRRNLKDLVRVVSIGKIPILLQGDTSVGKTSLITYLAKTTGHVCVRINNHEHTDLQEYVGSYIADETGKLVFKEGILVDAMRKGYWIILDELNLAPSDVLEALNRVLDDNRELFIPETQQVVKAHEHFMLFATQNPPGLYGGRKVLSRAFRNRFIELHFDEIPPNELQIILNQRCSMPESYCKQVINVMTDLQIRRKSTAAFAGKRGFITLRDLFRWGERYRLAPDVGNKLYDWSQHLADEGYLVLAAKVRKAEEADEIRQVIKKHLKRDVDPDNLFTLNDKTSPVTRHILEEILKNGISGFRHIVWTYHMRRIAVLMKKSCQFKEPVLLVGETGGGKTTVCQLIAAINGQAMRGVNCHMHTESSDFLGNLRPVRDHVENNQKLFEWMDGPLIDAMRNGDLFLADEISLADDSVLERLNSLLEPERSLLLAEKGIESLHGEENTVITADEKFIFVGTMNPGGDYGKKELSPALRNRFTEVWCEGCMARNDLRDIIIHNLRTDLETTKEPIANAILRFTEWLQATEVGKKLTVSIRDVLTWVNFINVSTASTLSKLSIGKAYYHGACLTYIDSLGCSSTGSESINKLQDFTEAALRFIKLEIENTIKPELDMETPVINEDVVNASDKFGILPFYIKKGPHTCENHAFTFTPTTKLNTLKLLRALQLNKPILLEGSPGVGKTSLVSALAKATGHTLLRINLSDQTDVSDLFGADLPVEGGKGGEFAWRDGPFLRALRAGYWILLDELNLASQSVLEGLNACFDHRGEIYIPELGKTFLVKPGTKLFGCQNPLRQGGARRGLPRSFLNRFTQISVATLMEDDLKFILRMQFPSLPIELINHMVQFNSKLASEAGIVWGHTGSPWEMNLRDVIRWCEITIKAASNEFCNNKQYFNPGDGVELIYVNRMRTYEDRQKVYQIYQEMFSLEKYPLPPNQLPTYITADKFSIGDVVLSRKNCSEPQDFNLLVLRDQKRALKSLVQCVEMNWMSILVGTSGSGKSSVVRLLAALTGQKLRSITVNSAMDTTEILGSFEQTDYNRHLEQLFEDVTTLLIESLQTKITDDKLEQVTELHEHLEQVRHLFDENVAGRTMAAETKLFLHKIEELSKLVSSMKLWESSRELELLDIESKLRNLSIFVEQDKCLNAGGKFEWVDSVLVKCLQDGTWLLIDQVNLCSPAVLDRLNGLLEPNGVLSIGERGIDSNGNVVTIKPHKNFRLFLTMNPRYGEISRAMRNRGVEIYMLGSKENIDKNLIDFNSLLFNAGIMKSAHRDALLDIYDRMSEEIVWDQFNMVDLLHTAFLVKQRLLRGFSAKQSIKNACIDVYIKPRPLRDSRFREHLTSLIDEIVEQRVTCDEEISVIDLDAATWSVKNLQDNSRLVLIRQQGLLLNAALKMYESLLKSDSGNIGRNIITTKSLNDFCGLKEDEKFMLNVDVTDILSYLLLNFYEQSSQDDAPLRKELVSKMLRGNAIFDNLEHKSELMEKVIAQYCSESTNARRSLPLDLWQLVGRTTCDNDTTGRDTNKLLLLLYADSMILNRDISLKKTENKDLISIKLYCSAVKNGKLFPQLKNQPLITFFVQFLEQASFYIKTILQDINIEKYIDLRKDLRWFSRFERLGELTLIDKAGKSKGLFTNLDQISLLLSVHYKWLLKFLRKLKSLSNKTMSKSKLWNIVDRINHQLESPYDSIKKISKRIKKFLILPSPHSTEVNMEVQSKLMRITKDLDERDEGGSTLKQKLKIISVQLKDALAMRKEIILLWRDVYSRKSFDETTLENIHNVEQFCDKSLRDLAVHSLPKREMMQSNARICLWPIYEYVFLSLACTLQGKMCREETISSVTLTECLAKFEDVTSIPSDLMGLLRAMVGVERKVELLLLPELFCCLAQFIQRSHAFKDTSRLLHWRGITEEDIEESITSYVESKIECHVGGPVLLNLVLQLMLNKTNREKEKNVLPAVALGTYKEQVNQLQLLNDILWKNSISLTNKRCDSSSNDLATLKFYLHLYSSTIDKMERDIQDLISMEKQDENFTHIKSKLSDYYESVKELRKAYKSSIDDENEEESFSKTLRRGKGWMILGYIQLMLFGNLELIDPVHKVELKLEYLEEDIADFRKTIYVTMLQDRILGISAANEHPRFVAMRDCEKRLLKTRDDLNCLRAFRPASANFASLSKDCADFRKRVGSYTLVKKHMNLYMIADNISRDCESTDLTKTVSEAETWGLSVQLFAEKIKTKYLPAYPDVVLPLLTALAQLSHGVFILINEIRRLISLRKSRVTDLESFIYNLIRFPTIGWQQENLLNLSGLCVSTDMKSLIGSCSTDTFVRMQEQFRIFKLGLHELHNHVILNRGLTKSLWRDMNELLQQIVLIWKQQQLEEEKRAAEKDSLYKNKIESHNDTLTEEEELALEVRKLFPSYREKDFNDIENESQLSFTEKTPTQLDKTESNFSGLITKDDIREIQQTHSNIVTSFIATKWICNSSTLTSSTNYIESLIQRYNMVYGMLDNILPSLSEGLAIKLYNSLNFLTTLGLQASQEKSADQILRENTKDESKGRKRAYDFYKDCKVEEVRQCLPLCENILNRVNNLLQEWPEHSTLKSIQNIIERIYTFSITSPVSRFLTGLELLLVKIHQWEENAHSGVSMTDYVLKLMQQIICWRNLELSCWKDCLDATYENLRSDTSKWWFFLYALIESYIMRSEKDNVQETNDEPITKHKLVESLEHFMNQSCLVEFESRLDLLLTFHCHVYYFDDSDNKNELLAILWNVYNYYKQFVDDVKARIDVLKAPIEKKLKDFVKIARWNDNNYWAVKETVEKTHRTLHKLVKEFQNALKQTVSTCLIVNPKDFIVTKSLQSVDVKAQFISELNTLLKKARKAPCRCEEIIRRNSYPSVRRKLEDFIESYMEQSVRLREKNIDRSLPKNKQKSQAKSILQQKKMMLANYFKDLYQMGINYRTGTQTLNNNADEVIDFTVSPLDLSTIRQYFEAKKVDEYMLAHWEGCEKYYYKSLIRLNALNAMLDTNRTTDLGQKNIERCRGHSAHLMLIAHKQKMTIVQSFDRFSSLRAQILNLSEAREQDPNMLRQNRNVNYSIKKLAENLKTLLITLEIGFEQLLLFLRCCPAESSSDPNGATLTLDANALPIIAASQNDEIWKNANRVLKENLNLVKSTAKRFHSLFMPFEVLSIDIHNSFVTFLDTKMEHFLQNNSMLFEKLRASTDIENGEQLQKENHTIKRYELNLKNLINMILLVIQEKFKDIKEDILYINKEPNEMNDVNIEKEAKEKLNVKLLERDIKELKLSDIYSLFSNLLLLIHEFDDLQSANHCIRLLLKCLPLLEQYILLVQFYLNEQVASFRITCKILYLQLNVFLDLAANGFCVPKDLDLEESEMNESEEKTEKGGMGLADGEGTKDVSDRIESEDQLEDARPADQEQEKQDDKACKEEEKGIDMSENFDNELQDMKKNDEEQSDDDDDEENDLDKEMGETEKGAEQLDKEIWGDDQEESEEDNQQSENESEEEGTGEQIGEKEMGARDDNGKRKQNDDDDMDHDENQEKNKKEINELDEPKIDEDHINPYHGKFQPQPEPEPLDLPEDMNLDEDGKEDNGGDDENPFDIDEMKKPPPEKQDIKLEKESEEIKENDSEENSSEDEDDNNNTGQSQSAQQESGHSGSSKQETVSAPQSNAMTKPIEKRNNPGESNEDRSLLNRFESTLKKLKTTYTQDEVSRDENEDDANNTDGNKAEMAQHIKDFEKFDDYTLDAATEDQNEEETKDDTMDVEMHEDKENDVTDDKVNEHKPEKVSEITDNQCKKNSDGKRNMENNQTETTVELEGETAETMKVERGNESTFHTMEWNIEENDLSSDHVERKRFEMERMLGEWTQVPSTEEATAAWNCLCSVTDAAARDLSEKLRLVLEPTQASRLKGDYKTGKRINMRKIIPYIASQFRKDKIWLRRTKPSKRDYQIVLALDDSSSMADNHSKELAFESLSLISKAMTYLEVGQLSVLSFGEQVKVLHPLEEAFTEQSGSRLIQEMKFDQKKTMIGQLVDFTVDMFESQCASSDNAKLLVVLSDGRGIFSEGKEKVNCAVRRARLVDIFLVFIIVDNPINKDSILDIRMPVFEKGKLLGIRSYMDNFPFPFYMILRDINTLPGVLSDALRQWFEVVGKIDT
ncbi:Midasin [Cyphomyrmex costatus]|uniref:Midasin n=2 Tax=Cyphomyrmex costatus TaxID=456900 RepID=A0A151ILK1_9HYME|nr:Midasin [Cyphomyrmex costatus]